MAVPQEDACRRRVSLLASLLVVLALLSACRTELLSKVNEEDANEALVALRRVGIESEKQTPDAGKTWTVTVDDEHMVAAMAALRSEGLPRKRHASLGDLFSRDGLVSTPKEERVRFLFGVSQELSETLQSIDGVITARVHVVLPENDPLARDVKPSSASVFIKHRPQADLQSLMPSIKNLVSKSIEGVRYETVSVTLVPGALAEPVGSIASSGRTHWLWFALPLLMAACHAGWMGWMWWRRRKLFSGWTWPVENGDSPSADERPDAPAPDLGSTVPST